MHALIYVGAEYIQHNPLVADGKKAFIDYSSDMERDYPSKTIKFVSAIAELYLVALHTHQRWPEGDQYVTMDLFQFDDKGNIIVHWDSIQEI